MEKILEQKSIGSELRSYIKDVPDFPKKGIIFKDITPLFLDGVFFQRLIAHLTERYQNNKPDAIVSVEARGFLLGAPLACNLGVSLVPVRKKGKLPRKTRDVTYDLEYGQDTLSVHEEDLISGQRVLIVDDVLATGGTVSGVVQLLDQLHVHVQELLFLIELDFLKGRKMLGQHPIYSLTKY
ncbi:MAG: adenine phosphoribosyltransferase [Chlamydiota bacterium]|nr:adenine phosphoribosyltransferase [Chlamydiota bacterium]